MDSLFRNTLIALILFQPSGIVFGQNDHALVSETVKVLRKMENLNKTVSNCEIESDLSYVCSDMTKLSCKDVTVDDGTGVTLSDADFVNKRKPLIGKAIEYYQDSILDLLQSDDPKMNLTKALILAVSHQGDTPECKSTDQRILIRCYQKVAILLAGKEAEFEFIAPEDRKPVPQSEIKMSAMAELQMNNAYKEALEKAHEKTFKAVSEDKLNKKLEEEIFPRVKKLVLAKIEASSIDEKTKKYLQDKIQNISYAGNDCSKSSQGSHLYGLLIGNAVYTSDQTFKYCNGYLMKNTSEFQMAQVIAHELTHSIDPCIITRPKVLGGFKYQSFEKGTAIASLEKQHPFAEVLGCLRTKESIGARRKSGAESPSKVFATEVKEQDPFCDDKDQLGESFSDWMGAEILPEYIDQYHPQLSKDQRILGYSNVWRLSCNTNTEGFEEHPYAKDRIDRLMMANPQIRKQMGCGDPENGVHYCKNGEVFKGKRVTDAVPPQPMPTGKTKTGGKKI